MSCSGAGVRNAGGTVARECRRALATRTGAGRRWQRVRAALDVGAARGVWLFGAAQVRSACSTGVKVHWSAGSCVREAIAGNANDHRRAVCWRSQ